MSEQPKSESTIKIRLDPVSSAFYAGVSAGHDVSLSMANLRQPYTELVKFFWLSVGTQLGQSGISGDADEEVAAFVSGASTGAPVNPDEA